MFGLGMPELLIIFVIILIIFGAGKLPQMGSGIGKGIKNFQKAIKGDDEPQVIPSPSPETPAPKDDEKKSDPPPETPASKDDEKKSEPSS